MKNNKLNPLSICLLTLVLVIFTPVGHSAESKHILVVHAYSHEYPWTESQDEGFSDTIHQEYGDNVTINTEHLDTKRIHYNQQFAETTAEYIRYKYEEYNPETIYVTDDNGLLFGLDYLSKDFPDAKLFFSGVNNYAMLKKLDPEKHTGVFEKKESLQNLEIIKQLLPTTREINIVGDASNTYKAIKEQIKKELASKETIKLNFISSHEITGILTALQNSPKAPILLTTIGAIRENGNVLTPSQTINKIDSASQAVIVSMEDAYLVDGVLGGYVTSGAAQGRTAAELMIKFLSGTPVSEIPPIQVSPNEYIFNDKVLESLKLTLPENIAAQSRIINPRLSIYEKYQGLFIGAVLTMIGALITVLSLYSIDVTSRNRKLHKQSALMSEQQKKLELSENKFHLLLERTQNPMLIIQNGILIVANRAAVHAFGYERPSELKGMDVKSMLPEDNPEENSSSERFFEMFNMAWEKGFHKFNCSWKTREGEVIKTHLSMTRIPYNEQDAIVCTCQRLNENNI